MFGYNEIYLCCSGSLVVFQSYLAVVFMERLDLVPSGTNSEHPGNTFSCHLCPRLFNNKRGLSQHLRCCRKNGTQENNNNNLNNNSNFHGNVFADLRSNSVQNSTVFSNDTSSHQPNVSSSIVALDIQQSIINQENLSSYHSPLIWGLLSFDDLCQVVSATYEEAVKWRRNLFLLPSGSIGKAYIDECSRLIYEWVNDSPLKAIAIKALMIMPSLLLQKSSRTSKAKDHSENLKRRFELWMMGDFDSLVRETRFIQSKFSSQKSSISVEQMARKFNNFMLTGKINSALRLLSNSEPGGLLPLNKDNLVLLNTKHPAGEDKFNDLLLHGPELEYGDYAYDDIDGSLIRKTAREIKGAAGPSNLDADGWRRLLTSSSFGVHSSSLCEAVAAMTRKLCIQRFCGLDGSIEALLACKLIPLDKNPGLRPIGVGEVIRRIMSRAVMRAHKQQIMDSAGDLQLCAGQRGGCEAAVHAINSIYNEEDCDAILLVDADNAFNRINRKVLLHNIRIICPVIATYVINSYCVNARLFITGGCEIKSKEGTTQGDPAAMPVYALGSIPLFNALWSSDTKQVAYADDLTAGGKLKPLLNWWRSLSSLGPKAGYFPKASKSWLIVKPEMYDLAKELFTGTSINVTADGKRHLGAVLGTLQYRQLYVKSKVDEWVQQLTVLSEFAKFYPQSAYCAFTSGFRHKFNYVLRTIPDISAYLQPVEDTIRHKLIPAICDISCCNDDDRLLLSLPVKLGGMAIDDITKLSDLEYNQSRELTKNLSLKIILQNDLNEDPTIISSSDSRTPPKSGYHSAVLEILRSSMSLRQLKANDIARADGASIWLSTLPLKSENYNITKREFYDAVALRYGWPLKRQPEVCVCKSTFSVDHALSCKVGGLITLRHNELVNITSDLLSSVCKDVSKEPLIQPYENDESEVRADVSARGFWQRLQRAFVDVRVFYPFARSYQNQSLAASMKAMESIKKRKYNARVMNAENGSFTPLIFTTNGGMSKETTRFFSRLAELIADKHSLHYSETSAWVKRKVSFSLLRTASICIRGSRSRKYHVPVEAVGDAIQSDKLCII